jgi:hypothetical protein
MESGLLARRVLAMRAVGALTIVVCLLGVAAAVSRTEATGRHVIRAAGTAAASASADSPTTTAVSDTTVVTGVPPTTSTTAAPAAAARATTTTTATPVMGQIFGVVRHLGIPISRARLGLSSGGAAVATTTTDGQGRYSFDGLRQAPYEVTMYAESAPVPCAPAGPCIGSAVSMEQRPVAVASSQRYQLDWEYPYSPDAPAPAPAPATSPSTAASY